MSYRANFPVAYEVNFAQTLGDSVTFAVSPATVTSGKITAIRVQDISRNIWYNWDDPGRTWSSTPSVVPGTNNLYVSFYVTNTGVGSSGSLSLSLKNQDGTSLATKTASVAPGGSVGLEYTGTMPNAILQLVISVTP